MSTEPLPRKSLQVGHSREIARGDSSTRISITITADPDSASPPEPAEFRQQLSQHAQTAVERQVNRMSERSPVTTVPTESQAQTPPM